MYTCIAYSPGIYDFNSATQNVTISAGHNMTTINITIMEDKVVEQNENFIITLTVPLSLAPGIVAGSVTNTTVTIIDTTSKYTHNVY